MFLHRRLFSLLFLLTVVYLIEGEPVEAQDLLPEIKPPSMSEKVKEVKLPSTITDLDVGGGGRFILLHMPELKKIAVFDVNELKVTGYLPATDNEMYFAAGATKALLVYGNAGVVTRFDLATQEKELTQAFDTSGNMRAILLGSASHGPAIVSRGQRSYESSSIEIDLKTLKSTPAKMSGGRVDRTINENSRISANGNTISVWESGVSPSGLQTLYRINDEWFSKYEHSSVGFINPMADGRHVLTGNGVFTKELKKVAGPNRERASSRRSILLPSTNGPFLLSGNFYLSFAAPSTSQRRRGQKSNYSPRLLMFGDNRPILTLPKIKLEVQGDGFGQSNLQVEDRVFFIPKANVAAIAAQTNDSITLHRLDVDAALAESGVDYLLVTSRPSATGAPGKTYEYKMDVKSKNSGLQFGLDSAPEGMKVSSDGLITWEIPTSIDTAEHKVIVNIKDAKGQELFHTFSLEIPEVQAKIAKQREEEDRLRQAVVAKERDEMRRKQMERIRQRDATRKEQIRTLEGAGSGTRIGQRTWTDSSGTHRLTATFVRIDNKQLVILKEQSGTEKAIPLAQLSSQDIYYAVESELQRLGQLKYNWTPDSTNSGKSPFVDTNKATRRSKSETKR